MRKGGRESLVSASQQAVSKWSLLALLFYMSHLENTSNTSKTRILAHYCEDSVGLLPKSISASADTIMGKLGFLCVESWSLRSK